MRKRKKTKRKRVWFRRNRRKPIEVPTHCEQQVVDAASRWEYHQMRMEAKK